MAYTSLLTPSKAFAVTPSDSTVLDLVGIYVGTTGNVAVLPYGNTVAVTFDTVPAGAIIPLKITKVMSTNTTASNIVGLQA